VVTVAVLGLGRVATAHPLGRPAYVIEAYKYRHTLTFFASGLVGLPSQKNPAPPLRGNSLQLPPSLGPLVPVHIVLSITFLYCTGGPDHVPPGDCGPPLPFPFLSPLLPSPTLPFNSSSLP